MPREARHIFYSWQSDLPGNQHRSFIQEALERAARNLRADDTLQVDPRVDHDTAGVAGAPDIAATIFAKIDAAAIFVGDVSFMGSGEDWTEKSE